MESRRPRPQADKEGPSGRGIRQEGDRPVWQQRVERTKDLEKSPLIPSEITPEDLDMGARVQLKTLTAENAEMVARHLAMVSLLIDSDAELAHKHALAASRRAGRLAIVHETLGITAYKTSDFALALRELLTHRRLTGSNDQLPLIVDSERGMGRPERALEAVSGLDRSKLAVGIRINLAIALSGARLDLGQTKEAKQELEIAELTPKTVYPQSPLLFRSYAEILRELGQDGAEWETLADRADHAIDNQDGELFDLVEEIHIPTSEEFDRTAKPERKFTPRDGERRERSGSPDRERRAPARDGERKFTPREGEKREPPSGDGAPRPAAGNGERKFPSRDSERKPWVKDGGPKKFGGRSQTSGKDFKPRGNRGKTG